MHLALHHAAAPGAILGGDRRAGRRAEAQARAERPVRQRRAGDPLDRDAEQDEVDVRIDRRAVAPFALQDEGAQPVGIVAIGVDRLDRGQEGAVGEAVAEGQPALGRVGDVILAQVGDRVGQRPSRSMRPSLGERRIIVGRGDHLGERGEVEPVIFGQRLRLGDQGGHAGDGVARRPSAVTMPSAAPGMRPSATASARGSEGAFAGARSCRIVRGRGLAAGDHRQEQDRGQAHRAGEEEEEVEAAIAGPVEALDDRAAGAREQPRQQEGEAGQERILRARDSAGSPASRDRRRRPPRPCRCRTGRPRWRYRARSRRPADGPARRSRNCRAPRRTRRSRASIPGASSPPSGRRGRRRRCSRPGRRRNRRGRSRSANSRGRGSSAWTG